MYDLARLYTSYLPLYPLKFVKKKIAAKSQRYYGGEDGLTKAWTLI